jgi:hypothetical protein
MNKLTLAFAKTFAVALVIMISALVIGCKESTTSEPSSATTYDSEAAADMTATALGNQSGGLGMSLGDSYALATTGSIPHSSMDSKGNPIMSSDSSYDPSTGWHTLNITKNITWNNNSVSANFVYKYQLIDTTGAFQAKWKRGLIDKINVVVTGNKQKEFGERLDIDDSVNGAWMITGLANFNASPIFTGSYTRVGVDSLLTRDNNERTLNHTMTINFANDTLIRIMQGYDKYFFLDGTATSTYHAVTGKGITIDRSTIITFHGDGTATLDVTRTKDGVTDTFTVDVVVGIFKRFGR